MRAEAEKRSQKEVYKVEVSEVYSPPRVTAEARKRGLEVGGAYDLQTGYDLKSAKDKNRMWSELEEDDPELTVLSPPCTPFSQLQELNFPKMDFAKVVALVGDGLEHWGVACQVAWWQYYRQRFFLLEHPMGSKAWSEESVQELMEMPGVHECLVDMCAYGMKVGLELNKKPTRFLTNSEYVAQELQRRCDGGHVHETLMGGKAALAAGYPPELCAAIVRGLKKEMRAKQRKSEGESLKKAADYEVIEVFMGRRPLDGLEDFEDLFPEEIEEYREEKKEEGRRKREEVRRLEAAVTEDDQKKVAKLHVNLGHPARDSFLRFLRAGRVREEIVKWVAKSFRCDACESHAIPKAPRPSIVPKCYKPGVAVALDLFYIPDVQNQRSIPVLNVVDMGTNYQMIEMLGSKEPCRCGELSGPCGRGPSECHSMWLWMRVWSSGRSSHNGAVALEPLPFVLRRDHRGSKAKWSVTEASSKRWSSRLVKQQFQLLMRNYELSYMNVNAPRTDSQTGLASVRCRDR